MAKRPKTRVVFRDGNGKFVKASDRYRKAAIVQAVRKGHVFDLIDTRITKGVKITPSTLVNVLTRDEFESLDEALVPFKVYTSKKKYAAWDVSEQVDQTKGIRRKTLKYTVEVIDGKRKRFISFYHRVNRNTSASYQIFRRINQEIGLEGMFLYDRIGGKILADRTGKKIKLGKVTVEKIV